MGIKSEIKKIYCDNTNYTNPSQAVNQASSLNTLSVDLYTDTKRFIYELLQNADDSSHYGEQVKVWIRFFGNYLVIAHSGTPFTIRDIQGLCNVNNGTKKNDLAKTGYKGIGFKSVFGQSNNVTVFTKDEYFSFDASYDFGWSWNNSKENWEREHDRQFQFPWQIIPIYTDVNNIDVNIVSFLKEIDANVATILELKNYDDVLLAAKSLSEDINMFLFLKNIEEINFYFDNKLITLRIERKNDNRIVLTKDNKKFAEWLTHSIELIIPEHIKIAIKEDKNIPEKLSITESIELSFAAKVENECIVKLPENEKLIYSYLPTDERKYSFPILVNTSFLTSANRESLHTDSKWNQWIFEMIPVEIFKWISKLVLDRYKSHAYYLIPHKLTNNNELCKHYNEGMDKALNGIAFIVDSNEKLRKLSETLVDFTSLSKEEFIGEDAIKYYIKKDLKNSNSFAKYADFFYIFKNMGADYFEWKDMQKLLRSPYFTKHHTASKNIELIKHLKNICESQNNEGITSEDLRSIPFIFDHKSNLNCPPHICFPTPEDSNWNNPNSELSFLHEDLQKWLYNDYETRKWLEKLGIKEKTDITYITQIILPKIESYITPLNAIKTIQDLFNLYQNKSLDEDLLKKLSRIKILTKKNSLLPANECYLSDFYAPRLKIESILNNDFFVSEEYCIKNLDKDEWKRFFKLIGVSEGITSIPHKQRKSKTELQKLGIDEIIQYSSDHKFQPFQTTFLTDCYTNIVTLSYIQFTGNNAFAIKFWSDYISNYSPNEILIPATAYWGYSNMPGMAEGTNVINYVPWFIKNKPCIPTETGKCETSLTVFLNTKENVSLAGKYLSIFQGPELTQDWKSFFSFKTTLELSDYLLLLENISQDTDDKGNVKCENENRIQEIYSILLDTCVNWSKNEIAIIEAWSKTGMLLNSKYQFSHCKSLKCYIDGNDAIFQERYYFIMLSEKNKNNSNLELFLEHFYVKVLRQSEFVLDDNKKEECLDLRNKLNAIFPYVKTWIEIDKISENIANSIINYITKIDNLNIYHSEELIISYQDLNFTKSVNVHFDNNSLYVTNPWNSNTVLLKLSEILCRYLELLGYEKKLDFLLRSTEQEIQQYFMQENINIPKDRMTKIDSVEFETENRSHYSFTDIETAVEQKKLSPEHFYITKSDYEAYKYVKGLIPRSVKNIIEHLQLLPEYNCTNWVNLAESIIGGITKNGNDVTIVARPSDNNKVIIYYESEFDVLKHVDAELWCEDGVNVPKQITMGHILENTGINKIKIENKPFDNFEVESLYSMPKSEILDFNAIPYCPEKLAKMISSFANTNGGTIIFGIKPTSLSTNEIVGLSYDFQIEKVIKKAITLLSMVPAIEYDWIKNDGKALFVIKTNKSDKDILMGSQKYIRIGDRSLLDKPKVNTKLLNFPEYDKTIAIIIAIEEYFPRSDNKIPKVKHALRDAQIFKEMLIKSMNVNKEDIHMCLNDAALKNILEYDFHMLIKSLTKNDRLIFYYVGHGFHNGVSNYLSTYDLHPHNIADTSISLNRLLIDPLKKSKCRNALIFIDACANNIQDENARSQINNINVEELTFLCSETPNYEIFLSCTPGQSSYSCDELQNGIWTHHLVAALNGEVPQSIRNDKYITDRLLSDYLSATVPVYVKDTLKYEQIPRAIFDTSYENVLIEKKQDNFT